MSGSEDGRAEIIRELLESCRASLSAEISGVRAELLAALGGVRASIARNRAWLQSVHRQLR